VSGPASPTDVRPAIAADFAAIARIVQDAYRHYIERIGQRPMPMLDDYAAQLAAGSVWVIEDDGDVVGLAVLIAKPDNLLLHNVAVDPSRQHRGFGRRLVAFAEEEAIRRGYGEVRLYTHVAMVENQRLYARLGYEVTAQANQSGFERVFMRKRLGH
jgi:ribosomal protein S18 acetylase RimI-like enzyme